MIEGDDRELFARSLAAAVGGPGRAEVDGALAELGWADALDADPQTAISLLFELQGRHHATSSALGLAVAAAFGVADGGRSVVLPALGSIDPPGSALSTDEGRLAFTGLTLGAPSGSLLVVTGAGAAAVVDADQAHLAPREGIDPSLDVFAAHADGAAVDEWLSADHPTGPGHAWPDALARAQLCLAHELLGASRQMLELARVHAIERIQFGQPIAKFQAVRHRLAEAYVAIEAADAAADAAWRIDTPLAAATAKAIAGRNARLVAKHAQQVLAGIGFTTEHDLHLYVRRVLVLDQLCGDSRSLTAAMGQAFIDSGALPPMLAL